MQPRTIKLLSFVSVGILAWWFFFKPAASYSITNESPLRGTNIIAFGDSITAGFGAPEGHSYPAVLSQMIGKPILNAGVPGETTGGGLGRLERDVLSQDPRIVLLCLGGNDMIRRQSAETAIDNLRQIITRCQAAGALVILIGVDDAPPLTSDGFDEGYPVLARETGCPYVEDVLDGIYGKNALMADNLHPNADGYRKMAERIWADVGEYLDK